MSGLQMLVMAVAVECGAAFQIPRAYLGERLEQAAVA
jgi:hypothetical protein